MSLSNMRTALKRFGFTQREVAAYLGMSENNFGLKLSEKVFMTIDEAKAIHEKFLPTVKMEYLLQSDGDKPSKVESLHSQVDLIDEAMRREVGDGDPEVREITSLLHECVNEWGMRHEDGADDRSAA